MDTQLITSTVLARLREPSSWGGIAVILAMLGLSQEQAGALVEILAAAAAFTSILMGEQGA